MVDGMGIRFVIWDMSINEERKLLYKVLVFVIMFLYIII